MWYHMSRRVALSTRQKRRQKVEQSPRQVRFEDLDALLRAYGFQVRKPKRGGSHYFYYRGPHLLSVPRRRPHLKEYVVRRALAMLQETDTEEASADEDRG
jgi:hypothetical protein